MAQQEWGEKWVWKQRILKKNKLTNAKKIIKKEI
jgi:hypothetical protein